MLQVIEQDHHFLIRTGLHRDSRILLASELKTNEHAHLFVIAAARD
jgi:hypothetical protein